MKALVLKAYGGIDQFELREVPDPKPGPGEVRVKVAATSVNPVDWKMRSGAARERFPIEFPGILGRDAAGEVVEVGAGVTALKPGDKVLGLVWRSYAEQVVGKAEVFAKVPPGLDLREAAALPLVLQTGSQLIDHCQLKKGQTVLVTGAAGGVGRTAVFAARKLGARVIAGVRKKQKGAAAELGADQVVALDDDAELAGLPELDAIADTVGGEVIGKLLARLKQGGTLGTVVGPPPEAKDKPISVQAFMAQPEAKRLAELAGSVARHELQIPITRRFPLAQGGQAQAEAERGAGGKVLITL